MSTVCFAVEFFTQQSLEVLHQLFFWPMPPDGPPGEKELPLLLTEKDLLGAGVDGNGAENVVNQPTPADPMAHILALLQEQKVATAELKLGQERTAAQLSSLVSDTEGLGDKVNWMGNKFEQEVQKIHTGQK